MRRRYDMVVAGSGFGGSLAAWIFRRLGHSVLLLERGRHPRFVIGESSTPLTNLLLEELADRHGLASLRPLSKWGTWRRTWPGLICGLKRGFTFFHHREGSSFERGPGRENELLVGASPREEIADTHWYRADFDQFLARQAAEAGVEYLDQFGIETLKFSGNGVELEGRRKGENFNFSGGFLLDATGPRGLLHRFLQLPEVISPYLRRNQALFSHFNGVRRCEDLPEFQTGQRPPYPVDDAAVHHVFAGGWVWVLRFCNGVVSAGISADEQLAGRLDISEGAPAWARLLEMYPSLGAQFAEANALLPFQHLGCLPFRSGVIAGPCWALLPSAAGFIDPLLSTGFPLTLLGIERLARLVEGDWGTGRFAPALLAYARQTQTELEATERLAGAMLSALDRPDLFNRLSRLYFAAAGFSEMSRRVGRPGNAPGFLLCQHPLFGPGVRRICEEVLERGGEKQFSPEAVQALGHAIDRLIAPFDPFGLTAPGRNNWHPADLVDRADVSRKLGVSSETFEEMLVRSGFAP